MSTAVIAAITLPPTPELHSCKFSLHSSPRPLVDNQIATFIAGTLRLVRAALAYSLLPLCVLKHLDRLLQLPVDLLGLHR
jgi:hypothetical protein